MTLLLNYPLIAALVAIVFAQVIKFPIAYFTKEKRASISIVTSTGGMPSSHSAAVSALITALVLDYGFASPFVAIATTFGVIVMFDSMGVRRQSGEQGILLAYLYEEHLKNGGQPIPDITIDEELSESVFDKPGNLIIKKYLGHKPLEVVAGTLTGIMVAFFLRGFF